MISYGIYSSQDTCGFRHALEKTDVLEFSIRLLSNPSEWIPLSITHINENTTSNCRRGYCVQDSDTLYANQDRETYNSYSKMNIQICGFPLNESVQLRWLMSTTIIARNSPYEDRWSLDDIEIKLMMGNISTCLMKDNFDNPILK